MATVEIQWDVPEGVEVRGYERIEEGHVFEVSWPLPETFTCDPCRRSEPTRVQYGAKVHVIRDLDLWGQPSFFVYQPPCHRCSHCRHRQWLLPPFKRKHVACTYRFKQEVLRRLIGATEEEVVRRLGISAERVGTIVRHQLQDEQKNDPQRKIMDVGLDEISLKKRHKLYATVLTDLTDPQHPRVLAVAAGQDQKAAEQCLDRLSPEQRRQVQTHRTDMSPAFAAACQAKLKHSQQVIDRFQVAKKLGEAADRVRKKDPCVQAGAFAPGTEEVPFLPGAFRTRPEHLTEEQGAELRSLFDQLPDVEIAYTVRWGVTEVFDTAKDRQEAQRRLEEYRAVLDENDSECLEFFAMYDAHREGILAYFDERKSSGAVEGINHKARVITMRCYGVKDAKTLWSRLCLDLNRAAQATGRTFDPIAQLTARIREKFLRYYTSIRKNQNRGDKQPCLLSKAPHEPRSEAACGYGVYVRVARNGRTCNPPAPQIVHRCFLWRRASSSRRVAASSYCSC